MTIREDALRMLAEALGMEDLEDLDETSTMLLAKTRILRLQSNLDRLKAQDTPTIYDVFVYGVENLKELYEETVKTERLYDDQEVWLEAAYKTYMRYCENVEYFPISGRLKHHLSYMLRDRYHNNHIPLESTS